MIIRLYNYIELENVETNEQIQNASDEQSSETNDIHFHSDSISIYEM